MPPKLIVSIYYHFLIFISTNSRRDMRIEISINKQVSLWVLDFVPWPLEMGTIGIFPSLSLYQIEESISIFLRDNLSSFNDQWMKGFVYSALF